MYDLIIKNGTVIDGTGVDGYIADVAIQDSKIAAISKKLSDASTIIDATGLVVTPGFIDSHSHADKNLLYFPSERIPDYTVREKNMPLRTRNAAIFTL